MATKKEKVDSTTFKELEQQSWTAKAGTYQSSLGKITYRAAEPLLDALKIGPGMSVLDVACGPGYGAAGAAARGAAAVGIDFAATMVAEAQRKFPAAEFREGDAEKLSFRDGSFDAVICLFGLLHFAEPERAIAEAYRVLRSGGRYALTVWAPLENHEFLSLVLRAIKTHGDIDIPLPPAPPFFRFSDREECQRALMTAGFLDPFISDVPLVWEPSSAEEFLEIVYKGTVRTALLLERQMADVRERIHQAIIQKAEEFKSGDTYRIGWSAVLAIARKP